MESSKRSKMNEFHIPIIEDYDLYEVGSLEIINQYSNRKLAPNIDRGGNVHLNILEPGACAGNHFHKVVKEFFINTGPEKLLLHLKNLKSGSVTTIEMTPVSDKEVRAYRAKHNVPHMIENSGNNRIILIIVVDKDNPSDTYKFDVL
jgi:hypothetical protein